MFEAAEVIFFDVGGTLYKNSKMDREYTQRLLELIATTRALSHQQAEKVFEDTKEGLKCSVRHITKVRAMQELGFTRSEVHDAFCKVDPYRYLVRDEELRALIQGLSQLYLLGIISNFRYSHLERILDALGLTANFFKWTVTEDVVRDVKPSHEPFLEALRLSRTLPTHCVVVGDSPTKDIRPAKEVGMSTILVHEKPSEIDLLFADAAIDDVRKLPALLKG